MSARLLIAAIACFAISPLAHAQKVPRSVAPDNLAKYWVMMNASVEGDAPIGGKNLDVPGCASVSFIVEKNGSTSNVKVQKVEPVGDLAPMAASIAKNLKFEPTIANAGLERVFSSLIFPFNLPPDPEARKIIMERCVIKPLRWSAEHASQ